MKKLIVISSCGSDEERNILFLEKFLPDLMSPYLRKDKIYCYHTGGYSIDPLKIMELSLKDSTQTMGCMCVSDYRSVREFRGNLFPEVSLF